MLPLRADRVWPRWEGAALLVLIRDGKEVDRLVGAAPKPKLESWLESHLTP